MRQSLKGLRMGLAAVLLCTAACGGVRIKPESTLPKALLQPLPAQVALVIGPELRGYQHDETRYGSDWSIDLGPGHVQMMETVFSASFRDLRIFESADAARGTPDLQAIFEPRIEQYSFATARDTTGGYWAVTIRYRISVLTPEGEAADSLALTGYGSSRAKGGNANSLTRATLAAMRDAAAKFLVQLPRQPLAAQLRAGQTVTAPEPGAVEVEAIEAVPIEP